ncbi:MAG: heparinase II/III family protein [Prevotella sp.]|nr:heparinase II/III family protein [Candidatus Prevotella equi]
MLDSYIHYGEQYLGKPWEALPATIFARFKKDGNRTEYEGLCFERRRQLAALVMAEIAEGKNRFMPDIINGLNVMMEETWWGIPAHYNSPIPMYDVQTVDLFNAETAGLIAWTGKELKTQLDRFSPNIYKRLSAEIERRMLKPVLAQKYWWKTAGMNWNPWICSNWLTCVMLYEKDENRKTKALNEIKGCIRAFINAYPNDGGCDEGTGYWDRAAASLFECMYWLSQADIHLDEEQILLPKIARMGAYIYKMYIGNDYCVNFADAHENKSVVQLNVLYPFALYLNDKTMREFAAYIAQQKDFWNNPARLYDKSGNFPTLGRELMLLRTLTTLRSEAIRQPLTESWLPDLQIMTARSNPSTDTAKGLYLAMKGGNNDESHNHNDVGSFIVYADGEPLFIDPGVGEYTSQTFGKNRYDIWTMQSQYHNLPQINGTDQHNGKQYAAKVINKGKNSLTLDIANAYPKEAKVKTWQRTAALKGTSIQITEQYELQDIISPTRLILITPLKPEVTQRGIIKIGSHTLQYPTTKADIKVENKDISKEPVLLHMWGEQLYRINIILKNETLKNSITLTIR